jgi:Ser/Thr protein kinase RdoA (MazF antagonist)
MDDLWQVAGKFIAAGELTGVREYGNGNINDTYLVEISGDGIENFILQRINTAVFTRPKRIIHNLRTFTRHVQARLIREQDHGDRRWEIPIIRKTVSGQDYYLGSQGSFWRGISFINHARSFDTAQDLDHAREAGYALGRFHTLVSDLDIRKMHDTLVGFHITPGYLRRYDQWKDRHFRGDPSPPVRYCQEMIESHRHRVSVLEAAKERGDLQTHIIHGDPKINNFMISEHTGQAVSVVDLDTVKPGLVHYDIGDCLRSACNPLGEETGDFERVYFDRSLAEAILEGYLSTASQFLTQKDYQYLYDAIWLIPFELGLRFFTDYLAGNTYFKVNRPTQNLERASVQFKLTASIEAQEAEIRAMISGLITGFSSGRSSIQS